MTNYIDVKKLKAEIERRFSEYNHDSNHHIQAAECASILDFIDSLQQEQTEVDLEKEIDKTVSECTNGYNFDWDRFAHYFYELGLNARKDADLEKTVEFECIGKKVRMTIQELINYYIDSECADVANECGF